MPILYHWRREIYDQDRRAGLRPVLHQASARLHEIGVGESLWAFTRNAADRYVLALELVVAAKDTIPEADAAHGRYRLVGDPERSRYFDVEGGADAEDLIRSLGIPINAALLGHAFQGAAAVRGISREADARLREFAKTLPTISPQPAEEETSEGDQPGRNPPWTIDELILAPDLYMTNPQSPPGKTGREVQELSARQGRRKRRLVSPATAIT